MTRFCRPVCSSTSGEIGNGGCQSLASGASLNQREWTSYQFPRIAKSHISAFDTKARGNVVITKKAVLRPTGATKWPRKRPVYAVTRVFNRFLYRYKLSLIRVAFAGNRGFVRLVSKGRLHF